MTISRPNCNKNLNEPLQNMKNYKKRHFSSHPYCYSVDLKSNIEMFVIKP